MLFNICAVHVKFVIILLKLIKKNKLSISSDNPAWSFCQSAYLDTSNIHGLDSTLQTSASSKLSINVSPKITLPPTTLLLRSIRRT